MTSDVLSENVCGSDWKAREIGVGAEILVKQVYRFGFLQLVPKSVFIVLLGHFF